MMFGRKFTWTKNRDSFVFAARRFFNLNTQKYWWLFNLYFYTLTVE